MQSVHVSVLESPSALLYCYQNSGAVAQSTKSRLLMRWFQRVRATIRNITGGKVMQSLICTQQDILFYSESNRKTMEGYNNLVNVGPSASSSLKAGGCSKLENVLSNRV